jgi:hypothetical protein
MSYLEPFVMYEVQIKALALTLKSGKSYEFPDTLKNGRANYILFEELIRAITGLTKEKQSDHVSSTGKKYEQKAYADPEAYPESKFDYFQTSASSTFAANNNGPRIKKLLEASSYEEALQICKDTGYSKNDFYIYTNTSGFSVEIPFRYVVIPVSDVLKMIDKNDPREISRKEILSKVSRKEIL